MYSQPITGREMIRYTISLVIALSAGLPYAHAEDAKPQPSIATPNSKIDQLQGDIGGINGELNGIKLAAAKAAALDDTIYFTPKSY